jgi:aspartyl protease family protein
MTRVFFALVALMISLWVFSALPARGTEITLRTQLEALAAKYGFVISGLDHISAGAAQRPVEGNVENRLKSLLEDYNHVVIAPSPGKIEKIIITSLKQPPDKRYVSPYVVTTHVGAQHRVQAIITGPNNQDLDVELVVDTGASTVVLPASMSTQLGFRPEDLVDGIAQTASDRIKAKIGFLKSVRVGNVSANDIKVTIIPDDRLGNTMLLGMSFLERFKVTIDDARNELILLAK